MIILTVICNKVVSNWFTVIAAAVAAAVAAEAAAAASTAVEITKKIFRLIDYTSLSELWQRNVW